jgi:hypothetical protein
VSMTIKRGRVFPTEIQFQDLALARLEGLQQQGNNLLGMLCKTIGD